MLAVIDALISMVGFSVILYASYVWIRLVVEQLENRHATTGQFVVKTLLLLALVAITAFLTDNAVGWIF